jgi:hypothetical protein
MSRCALVHMHSRRGKVRQDIMTTFQVSTFPLRYQYNRLWTTPKLRQHGIHALVYCKVPLCVHLLSLSLGHNYHALHFRTILRQVVTPVWLTKIYHSLTVSEPARHCLQLNQCLCRELRQPINLRCGSGCLSFHDSGIVLFIHVTLIEMLVDSVEALMKLGASLYLW